MAATAAMVVRLRHPGPYLLSSALAVNFFFEVVIAANNLSPKYFLYGTTMTVHLDILPPIWTTLLWIGSLYVIYISKKVVEGIPNFRQIDGFLNAALIGSFVLLFYVLLEAFSVSIQPPLKQSFDMLKFWATLTGYIISFAGSSFALLLITARNRSILKHFLAYLFSLLIPVELWSLVHWIAYPFDTTAYLGFAWRGALIELQMFYIAYPLILWLFIGFLFSWIWVPVAKRLVNNTELRKFIDAKILSHCLSNPPTFRDESEMSQHSKEKGPTTQKLWISKLVPAIILLCSLLVGVFVAYYPYLSQKPGLVGTDSLGYYNTLVAIEGKSIYAAAQLASEINSARILYHLMLYLVENLSRLSPSSVIELMPIITVVANVLAVFWFVKTGEGNVLLASMTGLFSVFSFTTTISIHAGTLANWLAVALGVVMFGLILRLQAKMRPRLLFGTVLVSALVFLIHYWSGLLYILVLCCYLFLMLWERQGFNLKILVAAILIASVALIAGLSSGLITHLLAPYGISFDKNAGVNFMQLWSAFWMRLPVLIDYWFLGAFANPVLLGLSILGIILCINRRTSFDRLIISWTIVVTLLSILISPIGTNTDQWVIWRTLYLAPFQIAAAMGLLFIAGKLWYLSRNEGGGQSFVNSVHKTNLFPPLSNNDNLLEITFLLIIYVVSALLLVSSIPVVPTIFLFTYPILTVFIHFKVKKKGINTMLVFLLSLLLTLSLFNYTLRSLAPLAVQRFQP